MAKQPFLREITELSNDGDCLAEMLDSVINYREHVEGMAELAQLRAVSPRTRPLPRPWLGQ